MLVAPAVTWVWQEEDQKNMYDQSYRPMSTKKHIKKMEDRDPFTSSEALGGFTGGPVSVLTAPMSDWPRWAAMARCMHDIKK